MSGRLSPSCSDQSQLFPLFFKIFLDSQCSVTLLAFWLFVVYKSAEWNKMYESTRLCKDARTSKNKSKTWYKDGWGGERGETGADVVLSLHLQVSECCSCQDRRHLWPFYSCLRVGWFNFCPRASQLYRPDRKKLIYQLYKLHRRDSEFALHVGIFLAADIKLRV